MIREQTEVVKKSKTPIYSTSVSQLFQWVERYFLKMLISLYDKRQTEVDKNLKSIDLEIPLQPS